MYPLKLRFLVLIILGIGLSCQAPDQAAEEAEASSSELKRDEEAQSAKSEGNSTATSTDEAAQDSKVPQPKPREGFQFAEGTNFSLETQENEEGGWAYIIKMNGKQMINQKFIPGVQGKQAFTTEDEARKVGELVKSKLENNIMPPAIRLSELDSLGVTYK